MQIPYENTVYILLSTRVQQSSATGAFFYHSNDTYKNLVFVYNMYQVLVFTLLANVELYRRIITQIIPKLLYNARYIGKPLYLIISSRSITLL